MTDKRILQLEEATDLTGAVFLVAKEDVNQKIGVGGMKEHLGINSNSPIESPTFTGDPKAPTPDVGDNDTSIATTEFATTLADMRSTVQGMVNLGVSVLPNGGNLLIAVKQADGTTDASETQPIILPFRVTATLGDWEIKKIEDALDFSVVSGATLGQTNGVAATVYVYLVNIDGALELAVAGTDFGTSGHVATTTAMTTGADSSSVMYSTTASATPVPFLKIAEADNTQATAGTWATQPTPIRLAPFEVAETSWFKALKAATSTPIADDAVTNAKLTNMAQATIKGRASGAGTGDPTDLTAAQVFSILGVSSLLQGALDETTYTNFFSSLGIALTIGSYEPTVTLGINAAAATTSFWRYMRFANFLIVGGRSSIDPTATGTIQVNFSLPVSNDITSFQQLWGVGASSGVTETWEITGSSADDTIACVGQAVTTSVHNVTFLAICVLLSAT